MECVILNCFYSFWNVDGCECGATIKSLSADALHAVRNSDGCEVLAVIKCFFIDSSGTLFDMDSGIGRHFALVSY